MGIVVESVTSTAYSTNANVVVNRPTGTTDGDLLIAVIGSRGTSSSVTSVPSGWTSFVSRSASSTCGLFIYWKRASSEPSSWTWTVSSGGDLNAGGCLRISDAVATSEPYAITSDSEINSNTATFTPGITPNIADSLLIIATSTKLNNLSHSGWNIATSNPTWTTAFNLFNASPDLGGLSVVYAIRPQTTATGDWQVTAGNNGNADYESALFAIRERVSANGNHAILVSESEIFAHTISVGTTASHNILTSESEIFETRLKKEDPSRWNDQTKSNKTWTDLEK